jgi:stage II sporulation protein D
VESPRASYRLVGPEATRFLRAIGLPSTLTWVEGGRVFVGRGSGHGVGLSQWGAKGFAEHGYDWREILGHYFPGTVIAPFVVRAQR